MAHKELGRFKCPECGGDMETGYITGHWFRLRWCKTAKTKTIFAGKPLSKKIDLWNAPTLSACRCVKCKVGMFRYDH